MFLETEKRRSLRIKAIISINLVKSAYFLNKFKVLATNSQRLKDKVDGVCPSSILLQS